MAYGERDSFMLGAPLNPNENGLEKEKKLSYLIAKLGCLIADLAEIKDKIKEELEGQNDTGGK